MDIGSLLIVFVLQGQLRFGSAPAAPPAAAAEPDATSDPQAASDPQEIDRQIEADDQSPALEGAPSAAPAAAPAAAATMAGIDEAAPEPARAAAEPSAEAMAPLQNVATTAGAADSLLRWLAEGDASLGGQRLALVDLLSRVYDRPQQSLLVAAYWKLSAAESEYRIAADEALRIGQLLPPANAAGQHPSDAVLEARLAAAEARLREAELAVFSQQYSLAEQMRRPLSEQLPLAADAPYAGAYRTYFQERYARVAPPRGHLIDRTLPLLHRSIELRAAAALSAADSADAEAEAYHTGQLDLTSAADSIAELTRQRRAFVAAVRDYNLDIAEYALSVVPAGLTSAQLVGILIGPQNTAARSKPEPPKHAAQEAGGVNQAGFEAPLGAPNRPLSGSPTLAPLRGGSPGRPTPNRYSPAPSATPAGAAPAGGRPGLGEPALRKSGEPKRRIKSTAPAATGRREPAVGRHVVAKPPVGANLDAASNTHQPSASSPLANAAADQGIYGALSDLSPLKRAQELSAMLHWDRQSSEAQGAPTSLTDALNASTTADRMTLIQTYWRGREHAAAAQVVRQEADLLQSLQAAALRQHTQPGGADSMLRLRTAQLAAQASNEEAAIGLLSAQFDLAQLMRRPLNGPWPWPVTPPHAGGYRLKLDAQSGAVLQSPVVQQVSRALPIRHEIVQQWGDAVVAADAARVDAAVGLEGGQRPLSEAIAAAQRLSRQTLFFLESQTRYNVQFAEYVLAVAPPGVPESTLAGALVVSQ